jgi:hypothetical protein
MRIPTPLAQVLIAVVTCAALVTARAAWACTTDAECDDGDSCSVADTCVSGACVSGGGGDTDGDGVCELDDTCPGVANPTQIDLDGDGLGNACDDTDAPLNVIVFKVQGRRNPTNPNGRMFAKGDFIVLPPYDQLSLTGGLLLRVKDQLGLDASFTWAPGDCQTTGAGAIKCKDATRKRKAIIKPLEADPRIYRYAFRLKRLDVSGPFLEPVVVTITTGPATLVLGTDRVGDITDCATTNRGLACRE